MNPSARLEMFGQELNDETFAVCRSDMMLKGQDASHIVAAASALSSSSGGASPGQSGFDSALDVAATLYGLGSETVQSAARDRAEDWSVPPGGEQQQGERRDLRFRVAP